MPKQGKQPRLELQLSSSEDDDEISKFHKQRDKLNLYSDQEPSDDTEEEEVFPLVDDESSDDEEIASMRRQLRQIQRNKSKRKMDSDLDDADDDDEEEDTGLKNSLAWGNQKSRFMGGDVRDNKIILSGSEDEAGAAALEAEECLTMEQRLAARMTEEDFMHPVIRKRQKKKEQKAKDMKKNETSELETKKSKKQKSTEEKTSHELETKKSEKEKPTEKKTPEVKKSKKDKAEKHAAWERMKAMHPEFDHIVADCRKKSSELELRLIPLVHLVNEGKIEGQVAEFLQFKYHIVINYLFCGAFYVHLFRKQTPMLQHHPVMGEMLTLQQRYNNLEPVEQNLKPHLDEILEQMAKGDEIDKILFKVEENKPTDKKRKATQDKQYAKKRKIDSSHEAQMEEDDSDMAEMWDEEEEEGEDGQRRAITKEMEQNKGLTIQRKKALKNPRVKHRNKYRRAVIRRKGQVREYKEHKEMHVGATTGIRAGIIRSQKLK